MFPSRYIVLNKKVGETPLACAETWRATAPPAYQTLPLAYAGRLDPMASGKLLILIGNECKHQAKYHTLDKRYEFSILLGVKSDTADVLGRLAGLETSPQLRVSSATVKLVLNSLTGFSTLPYPHFSAKTVLGKPLHTWTLENRLAEITIPNQTSTIYKLSLLKISSQTREQIYAEALTKINSIPTVTDPRKALGNDFRRTAVRSDWQQFLQAGKATDQLPIIYLACICSAGTYIRSLTEVIGKRLGNHSALAYHIHRTHLGRYHQLTKKIGYWFPSY